MKWPGVNTSYMYTYFYAVFHPFWSLKAQSSFIALKGIVHPKMNILSPFTHPQVFTKHYEYRSSVGLISRLDIQESEPFWWRLRTCKIFFFSQKIFGGKNTMDLYYGHWGPRPIWLPIFFKISYFVFSKRKKFIQVWNNLRVSKW